MWSGKISEFIEHAKSGRLGGIIGMSLAHEGLSVSSSEENSWERSLPVLARVFERAGSSLSEMQILVEVPLPGTSSRADVVILGQNGNDGRSAVVLELKQWPIAKGTQAQKAAWGNGDSQLHPSSQVQGYRDYLKLYSGALVDRTPQSSVSGAVFLHNMYDTAPLSGGVDDDAVHANSNLIQDCPAFGKNDEAALADWIREKLCSPPSSEYVTEFMRLEKRAASSLAASFKEIVNSNRNPWVLLDFQREAMATIEAAMIKLKASPSQQRQVIVVTGNPGSGKTVLALTALMTAFAKHALSQTCLVTTSSAQRHSIIGEICLAHGERPPPTRKISREPVLKGSDLRIRSPGLKTGANAAGMTREEWNTYCAAWREHHLPHVHRPKYDVVLVDEAQGLVMPDKPHVDGSQASSWRRPYGPQPWHIIMQSRLSIFFMDELQGYRQVESTTPEDICKCARSEGIEPTCIPLGEEQFRTAGGRAYVAWLDHVLGFTSKPPAPPSEDEKKVLKKVFGFADNPGVMRDKLREQHVNGMRSRLLAGYAWDWITFDNPLAIDSHDGLVIPRRHPPKDLKFCWAKGDSEGQQAFNLGLHPYDTADGLFGSDASQPATAGYPLTVRGRDLDHVGVLWGQDLVWNKDHWSVNIELVFGSDMPGLRKAVRDELSRGVANGPKMKELVRAVAGAYRILLTRPMHTARVWIEDPATAAHVKKSWLDFLGDNSD
jgi:hypothetical protein